MGSYNFRKAEELLSFMWETDAVQRREDSFDVWTCSKVPTIFKKL